MTRRAPTAPSRRALLAGAAALPAAAALPLPLRAQEEAGHDALVAAQSDLIFGGPDDFVAAVKLISDRGNPDMAAGLIQALRFSRAPSQVLVATLASITGETAGEDWFDWMLWQELNPQVVPHPSYAEVKRAVYLRIDPNFDLFLKAPYLRRERMGIRVEEITWGGVRKDGIPSLDDPELIAGAEADYLRDDDLVFGVEINGDVRAYPLRIMGWHEMFNETIGGVPVALAYCTLCGAGILFETDGYGRDAPFVFGSSGFLYRSNKLMFDRQTHSLWNQFTGKPVSGELWDAPIELRQRPVTIATWGDWRAANPGTRALSLNTGHERDYGSGVVYQQYFASQDLMFPAAVDQTTHKQKDYVFGVRLPGAAKGWPLKVFEGGRVLNDAVGGRGAVLIGDAAQRTVRAYERGEERFAAHPDGLADETGAVWTLSEAALTAPDGRSRARLPGHIAYWFAWNGYLGVEAELYQDG
ncbi:MAG: DUF3179 domain-containing protein [Pseudomonadota bacterium]